MGRKHLIVMLMMALLLLIYMVGQSDASRHTQVFKVKPKSQIHSPQSHTFHGYLPKAMPIPPSGPSRQHNDIGLQGSWRSP
ncbi:Protein IDA-LIKE 2 [Quillaja saponaria]|uniref:Protein IDA-LIKE 2 n=1 Tax=Quillaja saponaria TaxID=32244 RepID=A0AAD7PWC5_QUISA|nr:Protein IDA-LIKE 2 [Quillaja saponaria]